MVCGGALDNHCQLLSSFLNWGVRLDKIYDYYVLMQGYIEKEIQK